MKREIKFQRVFQHNETGIIYMTVWGNVNHKDNHCDDFSSFKSPSQVHGYFPIADREFTGLKDKNGKEIYEGDIVQKWFYNKKEWVAQVKHIDYIDSNMDDYKGKDVSGFYLCNEEWDYPNEEFNNLEVIGNIYENKNLLES